MNQRDKERENQLIVEYFQTMDTYRRLNWDSLLKGVSGREVQFLKTIERFHWTHPEVPGCMSTILQRSWGYQIRSFQNAAAFGGARAD
ncbi:hypothetical protein [Butyricicoccus porcorum]|uniref:Uncharacterized protein n=1 Tax=Butyricicoccus porcorum TaxID=1945634 RepID=A0A252F107_9FIRM|nr:hypothetical protein [Butyricicoccus porcorum]OUM19494.1 hypothetical protein CBW42_12780 [Butyricicoccus porcorum]